MSSKKHNDIYREIAKYEIDPVTRDAINQTLEGFPRANESVVLLVAACYCLLRAFPKGNWEIDACLNPFFDEIIKKMSLNSLSDDELLLKKCLIRYCKFLIKELNKF